MAPWDKVLFNYLLMGNIEKSASGCKKLYTIYLIATALIYTQPIIGSKPWVGAASDSCGQPLAWYLVAAADHHSPMCELPLLRSGGRTRLLYKPHVRSFTLLTLEYEKEILNYVECDFIEETINYFCDICNHVTCMQLNLQRYPLVLAPVSSITILPSQETKRFLRRYATSSKSCSWLKVV